MTQDMANLSEALGGLRSRPSVVHGGDGQRTVAVQVSNPRAAAPQHMEEAHVKLCIALRKAVFKHTWLRNNEELELRAASGGSVPPTMVTCSTWSTGRRPDWRSLGTCSGSDSSRELRLGLRSSRIRRSQGLR